MGVYPVFLSVVCVMRNQAESQEKTISRLADSVSRLVSDYESGTTPHRSLTRGPDGEPLHRDRTRLLRHQSHRAGRVLRVHGIATRFGFADVRNHLTSSRLRATMQTD